MHEFYEKRRLKRMLYSRPVLVVLLLAAALLGNSVLSVYGKARQTAEKLDERRENLSTLQTRVAELEGDVSQLATARGIEAEIREKYEVARPSEHVLVLVEPETASTSEAVEADSGWWEWFTGWF